MNRSARYICILGLFGLSMLLFAGCENKGAPGYQAAVPEVGVVTMKPSRVVLTTELVGRTVSYLQAEVRPQVRGLIRRRDFVEGGDVIAGQTLYQIESDSYKAAHDNAKAALAKAEANLEVTRLRARRVAELRKTNAISQQDNDDAQAAYLQAQAEVSAAEAALDSAAINLNRTHIAAPISGRISKSSVTVGALVTADQPAPLATIHQMDPMYVDMTQSAEELMFLQRVLSSSHMSRSTDRHLPVKLLFSDGREYAHMGELQFADVGVNEATGTVTIRAKFPNPNHELLPGLYVRAVLIEGEVDDAILVPQRSTLRDNRGNPLVMLVTPEGTAERRPIRVGKNYDEDWVVLDGLKAGDTVIIEGIQRVRPGSPIRAVPYVPKTAPGQTPPPAAKASPDAAAPDNAEKAAEAQPGS